MCYTRYMFADNANNDPIVVASKGHSVTTDDGVRDRRVHPRHVAKVAIRAEEWGLVVEQYDDLDIAIKGEKREVIFSPDGTEVDPLFRKGDPVRVVARETKGTVEAVQQNRVMICFPSGRWHVAPLELVHYAVGD